MLFLIHDTTTGEAVSSSPTFVTPGPGRTSVEISDTDHAGLIGGWLKWNPATRTVIADPAFVPSNLTTLQQRAQSALAANAAFLATVVARRTAIANGKTTAITGQTASVANVAQAQTQIRSIWTTLTQVATALSDLNDQAELLTKQNDGVIRMLLGLTDSIADS